MPRRKKPYPEFPYPPHDRPMRPDELELGAPRAQEILRALARGEHKKANALMDKLNILQMNQLHGLVMGLKQAADARQKIPPNIMDFMLQEAPALYKEAKHLRLIGEYVDQAEKADTPHLWVSAPPGHAKTTTIGYWEIISYMARFPQRRCAFITHKYELAEARTRRIRNWIRANGKKFGLELDETSKAAGRFTLRSGGSLSAFGVTSGIMGIRFDGIVVLDDPIGSVDQVRSSDQRDKLWESFLGDILNRLDPGGKILGIMTRFHEDDIVGRCMTRMAEVEGGVKFDYLVLPAIAVEDDVLGRAPGAPLWPERFPLETLNAIRATYTPYMWSCIYQQVPVPDEGAAFHREWWEFYEKRPDKLDVVLQSWDMAFGDLNTNDYTVGIVMGRRGPHIYILDVVRERMDFPTAVARIKATSMRYPGPVLIERSANGFAAIAMLAKEIPGILPIVPKTSKEIRVQAVLPFVEAKNVWLPKVAPWLEEFLRETASFPNAKHDDQVDALSQGLNYLMYGSYSSAEAARRAAKNEQPPQTIHEIYARQFSNHYQKVIRREEARVNRGVLPGSQRWAYPADRIGTPGGEVV